MIVSADYSKWKVGLTCRRIGRPFRCMWALATKADTAPTEFSIAVFLVVYSLRMLLNGVGYWADSEYALVVYLGLNITTYPWLLFSLAVVQFCSLFSHYPNTTASRLLRVVVSGLSVMALTFLALARWLQAAHEPGWIPFAGLAMGGLWIFIRTRRVRSGS